ncbi:MAG: hypothetical protein Q7R65_00125 [bacterium]|nr:hypothetical protein [bacterium]
MSARPVKNFLLQDGVIIFASILAAAILVKTELLTKILISTEELELLGSFVAGMFFTSVFTTPMAIVTLGKIASVHGVISTAILGASGAVIGDLIIFRFIRDRLGEHLLELMRHQGTGKKFKVLLKLRYFRWFTFMVGGLIIASPLPDELGVSLMGFSKMRLLWFIPLSFLFNFIGIVLIGIVARTL